MKKLFHYLKPYWFLAVISPIMMMGEVFGDLCLPYLMSFIVDFGIMGTDIHDPEHGSTLAAGILRVFFGGAEATPVQMLYVFGGLMLAITLIGGFFGTFCAWTAAKASQGFGHDLRRDAYARVMSLSIEQTDRFTTGSLVTRMTNDVSMMIDFIEMLIRFFVRAPMFFIIGTVMLLSLNLRFGFVLLCFLPILALVLYLVLSRSVPLFGVIQKKLDRVNSVVQENVNGVRVVKACVKEEYECERFEGVNRELRDVNLHVLKLMALLMPVMSCVMNFAIIAIIYVGGNQIQAEYAGMSTGSIMAAISYVTRVLMSIMMVAGMFNSVSRALASGRRVAEILDADPVLKNADGNVETVPAEVPAVSFKNVSFRYPGTVGRPVLHDIDLDIRRGEVLAVIGATGCGKTSLVNLVPRFYDPTEGQVLVDGMPTTEYDMKKLRRKIGYVMQKSELFSGTVAGNIRWGDENADDVRVKDAADTAQATEFVNGFTGGFDGYIAEKGASLSGGQKQRLSIARALARKPEILILDDATSALDLATESKLRTALREKMQGTTVILIAQRIASVMNADRIAVIEDGTIRACAPHDELLRTCETYRDIYASQQSQLPEGMGATPASSLKGGVAHEQA